MTKAEVKILIFKDPYMCDDNFISGWTPSACANLTKDGDTMEIQIKAGCTNGTCSKNVNFNTVTYSKLVINCVELTANRWEVWLRKNGLDKITAEYTTEGLKIVDLSSYEGDIDEIVLYVSGSGGTSATFDFVAVCKDMLDPLEDGRLKRLEINDCVLQKGIAYALLTLENSSGYANNLSLNSRIIIWLSENVDDLGLPKRKVFGGIINKKRMRKSRDKSEVCEIECLGLGVQLQTPPNLICENYSDNGKDIILDVLEKSGVDITGYKVDPDDEIATSFSKTYDDEIPFNIINEICEESKKSDGTQGFEAWVDPAGNLWVYPKGKYDNGLNPAINPSWIINITRELDLHRVRNKVTVYGAWGATNPENADMCESLTGWTLILGNSMQLDSGTVKHGDYSIKIESAYDTDSYKVEVKKTLDDFIDGRPGATLLSAEYLVFDLYLDKTCFFGRIELYAPDESNKFYLTLGSADLEGGSWLRFQKKLGPNGDFLDTIGSPKWEKITVIKFFFRHMSESFTAYLDGVHFSNTRYKKVVEDTTSQASYGVRCKEHVLDESLTSFELCQLRGESIINFLKDPVEALNVNILGGFLGELSDSQKLAPGWKTFVAYSDLEVYGLYRIVEMTHLIDENQYWTINLKMNEEAIYIDKILRRLYTLSQG